MIMQQDIYDFGLRLKEQRKKANMTQSAIAQRLGVTVGTVKKYENNTLLPPIDKLETMALAYNTSLDYLRNLDNRKCLFLDDIPPEQQTLIFSVVEKLKSELKIYSDKK